MTRVELKYFTYEWEIYAAKQIIMGVNTTILIYFLDNW